MKKPSMTFFVITLILAAAVCTTYGEPVIDTNGIPVRNGEQYFIQSVKTGGGLLPTANLIFPFCPLGIAQTTHSYQPGIPVKFQYIFSLPEIITTSSFVYIQFISDIWPVCNEFPRYWKVDNSSSVIKEPAILIGDENRSFKIDKAGEESGENIYKLTTVNGTVGVIPGACLREAQLVLTNVDAKTLLVKFKKVHDGLIPSNYEV